MREIRVWSLTWEDSTGLTTTPRHHNYWACTLEPKSHSYWTLHTRNYWNPRALEPTFHKRSHISGTSAHPTIEECRLSATREKPVWPRRPAQPKNKLFKTNRIWLGLCLINLSTAPWEFGILVQARQMVPDRTRSQLGAECQLGFRVRRHHTHVAAFSLPREDKFCVSPHGRQNARRSQHTDSSRLHFRFSPLWLGGVSFCSGC